MSYYKIGEWSKVRKDFEDAFKCSIQPFYDGLLTVAFKRIVIDIIKFDDYLHQVHGNYEEENKSMEDIVKEYYGENGFLVLQRLTN